MNMAGLTEFSYYYSDMANSISSNFGGGILSQKGYYMSDSHPILASKNSSMSIDICMADMKDSSSFLIEGNDCLNQEMSDEILEESAGYLAEPIVAVKESKLRGDLRYQWLIQSQKTNVTTHLRTLRKELGV